MALLKIIEEGIPNLKDAGNDFEKLKKINVEKNIYSLAGNKTTDHYFFIHRIKTSTRNRITHYEVLKSGEHDEKIISKIQKLGEKRNNKNVNYTNIKSVLSLYYGTANQFKACSAKYFYVKYNAKHVLDFSSGWGGRCLAACSLDIQYTGIDTNKNLRKPYNDMIKNFGSDKQKIYFQDSSKFDFSKIKNYDVVFTSPPYFMIERYENMPQYKNNEDFINNFIIPTTKNSFQYLNEGGYFILNCPEDYKKEVVKILGEPFYIDKYVIASRFKNKKMCGENVYIWKK